MLHAPLVLPPEGVAVQVVVSAADAGGARVVSVFSRPDGDGACRGHCTPRVSSGTDVSAPGAELAVWPPVGAREVDVADAYAELAARGYQYGPAFQGLTAMWRRGDEVFAEVKMSKDLQANGFGVHPVLLDGALHAVVLGMDSGELALPFSWQKVSLHASGASAVRARIAKTGASSMSIDLADGLGLPVLSVAAMVARPVSAEQLAAAVGGATSSGELFEVVWTPLASTTESRPGRRAPDARPACRRNRIRRRAGGLHDHAPGTGADAAVAGRARRRAGRRHAWRGRASWRAPDRPGWGGRVGAHPGGADRASGPNRLGGHRC